MSDGATALNGFSTYYSATGSHLTVDGKAYNYSTSAGSFSEVDRPAGDVTEPSGDSGSNGNDMLVFGGAAIVVIVILLCVTLFVTRKP